MAKMDKTFSAKGQLYRGDDGRIWILETAKNGEEKIPFEDYIEQFLELDCVSVSLKETKKINPKKA